MYVIVIITFTDASGQRLVERLVDFANLCLNKDLPADVLPVFFVASFVSAEQEEWWRLANCCRLYSAASCSQSCMQVCGAEGSGNDGTDSTRSWSRTGS